MKKTIALIAVSAVMLISSCGLHQSPTGPQESTRPSTGQGLIPPGVSLDSARLFLHVGLANGQSIITHPLHQPWDETTVTWNSVGAGLSPFVVATFLPFDTGWVSSDASGLVGAWLDGIWENHGIVLDQNPPEFQRTRFHSREGGPRSARLVLYCSSVDSSPVYTLTPVADAYIQEDQPEMNAGADTALYSGSVELDSGEHRALIRFDLTEPAEPEPASLGDRVWHDLNADGIQDEGEPGLPGVRVRLYNCDSELQDETESDVNGLYRFESLLPGPYVVKFQPPADYFISPQAVGADREADSDADPATGRTECIELPEGTDDASRDAGFYVPEPEPEPSSLGDRVWHDLNADGIQDEGEPGLPGVRVRLYNCDLVQQDETESDADGFYIFESLPVGRYIVEFQPPVDHLISPQAAGIDPEADSDADPATGRTECIELSEGTDDASRDAGFYEPEPDTPGCTHGRRFWYKQVRCGAEREFVGSLLPIWLGSEGGETSIAVTTPDIVLRVLRLRSFGHPFNGITWLYSHLLVAKLNIAAGASAADIQNTIADADAFLANHDWHDWSGMSRSERRMIRRWRWMLLRYNYGLIGPGRCRDSMEGLPPLTALDLEIDLIEEKL